MDDFFVARSVMKIPNGSVYHENCGTSLRRRLWLKRVVRGAEARATGHRRTMQKVQGKAVGVAQVQIPRRTRMKRTAKPPTPRHARFDSTFHDANMDSDLDDSSTTAKAHRGRQLRSGAVGSNDRERERLREQEYAEHPTAASASAPAFVVPASTSTPDLTEMGAHITWSRLKHFYGMSQPTTKQARLRSFRQKKVLKTLLRKGPVSYTHLTLPTIYSV